jgi:predicted aldo/keto reductase-like oxidoreductase
MQRLGVATASTGLITSAFAGFALTPAQKAEAAEAVADRLGKLPRVKLGTKMGNMEIAPIIYCQDNSAELLGPGLDAGMNFIHKAGYWRSMPEALKNVPRDSYYTDITVDSTPNDPDNEDKAYAQVVNSLAANGLKYYDIFRAHYGWHSVKDMKELRGTHRAFDRLKKEGKVRYFGVSQHAGARAGGGDFATYQEMIAAQIDEGLICSIQAFINYATPPEALAVFEKAHKAGIGITAMKTVAQGGGKMRADPARMEELKAANMIGRACIRHVLTLKGSDGKPYVDCAVSSLRNFQMFEENLGSVALKAAAADGFHYVV